MSAKRLLVQLALICVVCAPWDAQSQDSLSAKSYYKRAQIAYDKGEITLALADYNKSISINPKVAMAYYGRGLALYASGHCDKAIADFDHAIAISARLADAYNAGNSGLQYRP